MDTNERPTPKVEVHLTLGPGWFLAGVLVVLLMSLIMGWMVLTVPHS